MVDNISSNRPQQSTSKLIEVDLRHKYCPRYLVRDDGSVFQNDKEIMQTIDPGIVKLHGDDAAHVLQKGVALPTAETFKGI